MWTYVENELDSAYSKPLLDVRSLKETDLPKAEFELRTVLASWLMVNFVPAKSLSWVDKVFNKADFEKKQQSLESANYQLKDLLVHPQYMAALQRVVSVMPDHVPQKQYLIDNFIDE